VEHEWILEPGDMLYLPPHVAHDGIALDSACQTWSVGFRSPSFKELLQEGLWRLAESLEDIPELDKKFADPGQRASNQPEQIPHELIAQLEQKLKGLKLNQIGQLLPGIAAYLSEPKPQAFFSGPDKPLTATQFSQKLRILTLFPHPQTRILAQHRDVYCNGELVTKGQSAQVQKAWYLLASQKTLTCRDLKGVAGTSLYEAYLSGWLIFSN
jgi:50S ribosomal protein L16 3-hydroxylase